MTWFHDAYTVSKIPTTNMPLYTEKVMDYEVTF